LVLAWRAPRLVRYDEFEPARLSARPTWSPTGPRFRARGRAAGFAEKGDYMNPGPSSALDASVLVLNKLFMAVHIISVRRAFCLLCKDLAEVVSLEDGQFATYDFATWREVSEYRARHFRQEDDDWVRTVSCEIQVPRVIRLLSYEKLP